VCQVVWWDLSQNSLQLSRPWVLKKGLTWDSMGAQVAVGYKDGAILVWDMVKGTCETVLKGHKGAITALAYNRKHRYQYHCVGCSRGGRSLLPACTS
jgi:U3 small nucleolar RNA-associated protein 12